MAVDNVTKSGRVRKKSAKLIEMEEAEELEKKFLKPTGKPLPVVRGTPTVSRMLKSGPKSPPEELIVAKKAKQKKDVGAISVTPLLARHGALEEPMKNSEKLDTKPQRIEGNNMKAYKESGKHKVVPEVPQRLPKVKPDPGGASKEISPPVRLASINKSVSPNKSNKKVNKEKDPSDLKKRKTKKKEKLQRVDGQEGGLKMKIVLSEASCHPQKAILDPDISAAPVIASIIATPFHNHDDHQPAIWPGHSDSEPSAAANPATVKPLKKKKKKIPKDKSLNDEVGLLAPKTMLNDDIDINGSQPLPQNSIARLKEEDDEEEAGVFGLKDTSDISSLIIDESTARKKQKKRIRMKSLDRLLKKRARIEEKVDPVEAEVDLSFLAVDSTVKREPGLKSTRFTNASAMAMKVKTSAERKASFVKDKAQGKFKKKRRKGPTAYTMFSNHYRAKVLAENPGIDFAQISKRLGEIWQSLPQKEKISWKRKAKRRVNKLISIVKGPKESLYAKLRRNQRPHSLAMIGRPSTSTLTRLLTSGASGGASGSATAGGSLLDSPGDRSTGTQCNPIDVAAHLKLLGDSLSIIGSRLQEHRGPIAVQGSLSVLLDSALCAMAPLLALTDLVPEYRTIPASVRTETLDNIAYIMPGIG